MKNYTLTILFGSIVSFILLLLLFFFKNDLFLFAILFVVAAILCFCVILLIEDNKTNLEFEKLNKQLNSTLLGKYSDTDQKHSGIFKMLFEKLDQISKRNIDIIDFAAKIATKQFDIQLIEKDQDLLFSALNKMKINLNELYLNEVKNNWSNLGITEFAEKIRENFKSIDELCFTSLTFLIKYLKVNQGSVFIWDELNTHLDLKASYAYGRKKHHKKQFKINLNESGKIISAEGLTGQCFLEKESIILTEVPIDYVEITSGSGSAPPRSVMLFPIKLNDSVVGIIEFASFTQLEDNELKFIEKACEVLASTILNYQTNGLTKKLLEDSQSQTQVLREKEEQMRQNMEELSAIQEDLERNRLELLDFKNNLESKVQEQTKELVLQKNELLKSEEKARHKEKQVIAVLNNIEFAIFLSEESGHILLANEATSVLTGYSILELQNMNYSDLIKIDKLKYRKPFTTPLVKRDGTTEEKEISINKIGLDNAKGLLFFIKDLDKIL